jgi:hypothetical protein
MHRRELLIPRDRLMLTWHLHNTILNSPPKLLLAIRQRRVAHRIRQLYHLVPLPRSARTKRYIDSLRARSGAAIFSGQRFLLAVFPLYPDQADGGQVDGNDGEVEFECDNDDGFAEPAGDGFDVDDSEERVVADNAHDHGAGTKGEDG